MKRKSRLDETTRKPVTSKECDEALCQILTVPVPDRPRSENRAPTKKELNTRYKLTRRK